MKKPLHSSDHGIIVHVPVLADNAIPERLLDIPPEPLHKVLLAMRMQDRLRRIRIQNLVNLSLQHLTPHVHPSNLHMIVRRIDCSKVLVDVSFKFRIVHGHPRPDRALRCENRQLLIWNPTPSRIVHRNSTTIGHTEPQIGRTTRRCRPAIKCNSFHNIKNYVLKSSKNPPKNQKIISCTTMQFRAFLTR